MKTPSINPLVIDDGLSDMIVKSIQSFRNFDNETLDFNNEFLENIIKSINKYRVEFHSVIIDTTYYSDSLVKFGSRLIHFFNACSDKSVSNKEISIYLNLLLKSAKRNKTEMEKTNFKVKSLMKSMSGIHRELKEFDYDNLEKVDPKTYGDLKEAEKNSDYYEKAKKIAMFGGLLVGGAFTGVAIIGAAAATATEVAILGGGMTAATGSTLGNMALSLGIGQQVSTAGALAAGTGAMKATLAAATTFFYGSTVSKAVDSAAEDEKKKVTVLEQTLHNNQEDMKKKSHNLESVVFAVIQHLGLIEKFWNENIAALEDLIDLFEISDDRPNGFTIRPFEEEWKKATEKCKEYSRVIKNELNNDMKLTNYMITM